MKHLIVASLAATALAAGFPGREHDPKTIKSCIDWYDNYNEKTCEDVRSYYRITPEDFHTWNPSIGTDCKPWLPISYCVLTKEKWEEYQKNHTTTTTTTTPAPTSTSTLGPTPTAWRERGCYADSNKDARVMDKLVSPEGGDAKLTLKTCEDGCYRKGYKFAGVENGNQCWCSSSIAGEWASDQNECNMPCAGDGKVICGGKERVFVYEAQYADPSRPITTTGTISSTTTTTVATPASSKKSTGSTSSPRL
ncbi:hypothetical protein LMH87_000562 [Akanthomyces muscarius]|uniref:WSC domain-containing protein n=1 Tax=Akanthomyces muscarius TaxID=2231603 RepID=A0A9W8QI56_AKAMU|nr:hypothetical protein LMH87_000562 [Akanthomyces muscarius]KAJ4155308.1 hypothetical protein LMH87_000562 [Akanthomyces muscarius]